MKLNKKFLFFLSFLILLLFLIAFKISSKFTYYNLEGKNYFLKIARTPEEWQRGLMFVRKPVFYDGMIFIFPSKEIRTFWNQNTFLDLDIYWLDGDKIVGKDYLPSIKKSKNIIILTSPLPVDRVIEIIR